MRIMLIGGPYDNDVVDVRDPPMLTLNMAPKLEPVAMPVSEDVPPRKPDAWLVYELEEVVTSPHKWHYEYHYQSR